MLYAGDVRIIELLLSLGCSPFVRDHNGKTALHLAEGGGHSDAAAILRAKSNGNSG
jgi:ankyrin repeat protein